MKLVEFTVTNYRSITSARKIPITDKTVLVGKNNEGKSNLLMALNVAMNAVIRHGRNAELKQDFLSRRRLYDWNRDFPIQYQNRTRGLESIFKLHFKLTQDELEELKKEVKVRCNDDLIIEIKYAKIITLQLTCQNRVLQK